MIDKPCLDEGLMTTEPIIDLLIKEFDRKRKRNPSYSLRAYSKYLEIDPSNLSKIIKGSKVPGGKLASRLCQKLGINYQELESLTALQIKDENYSEYAIDQFTIISDWYHYAILELIKIDGYQIYSMRSQIAGVLEITYEELEASLARLSKLEYISIDIEKNIIVNTENKSSSIISVSTSEAHRNGQKQILEKAIDALDSTPIEMRSQSSMTMAIDKNKISEAKNLIKNFRRELASYLSNSDDLNEVYHLSISLYPVSNKYKEEHDL